MRINRHSKWGIAVVASFLFGGTAIAQSRFGGSPSGSGSGGFGNGSAGGMGSGQVSFQGAPRLSPEEQVKTADALLSQMEQQASALGKRQLRASAQSDVVLANCLKDKVTQLDVAIRSARERRSSLTNPELRDHAFTIISFQKANADRVVKEANQCVGKEAVVTGETTVSAQISVVLPPDENSSSFPVADAPTVILAPPVAASTDL